MIKIKQFLKKQYNFLSSYCFPSNTSTIYDNKVPDFNLDNLGQSLISELQTNQYIRIQSVFQRNLNLATRLYRSDNIDSVKLSSELMKYNQFIFNEYIRQYDSTFWGQQVYKSHFVSIQQIAARILYEDFNLKLKNKDYSINKEILYKINPEYIEQDIYQLFGIRRAVNINYAQLKNRYQITQDFQRIYADKLQFQDYVKYINIQSYLDEKEQLIVFRNKLDYVANKLTPVSDGYQFISQKLNNIISIPILFIFIYLIFTTGRIS